MLACHAVPYAEARQVLDDTAKLLSVPPSDLDHSIWKRMSEGQSRRQIRCHGRPCNSARIWSMRSADFFL